VTLNEYVTPGVRVAVVMMFVSVNFSASNT